MEQDSKFVFSDVVLIEDDPAHAVLIERALSGVVDNIQKANTGRQGLELAQQQFPDLVLCDLHLPDMSGLEIVGALCQNRPALPVIVMTSSKELESAVSAMRIGAWDYMTKHFDESFAERLKIVVERAALRKQKEISEFKLRAERNAFWMAADFAPDALSILGADGRIVFANKAFERILSAFGVKDPSNQVNLIDMIRTCDASTAEALSAEIAEARVDSVWTGELSCRPEEQERFFELTLSSANFEEKESSFISAASIPELRRFVLWVRDITRRKEQEQFQRDLLSTTSHDLKGPLSAVLNSAELLAEDLEDNKEHLTLAVGIGSCARNAITIIDELLSARRIQDGVLVVKPRWLSAAETLEDTILDYSPSARAKNISLTSTPAEDGLSIYGDKVGMQRILGNLVSNAIKFTPSGGKVVISATRHMKGVRISVSDNGPGIEPEARHLLFQRYSRLEKHQGTEGTGLGLFVAKNIIDAHAGTIDLQSVVGEGTTFHVYFPDLVE